MGKLVKELIHYLKETNRSELKKEIPKEMKKDNIHGLAIALVTKEEIIWMGCFGFTDEGNSKKIDKDTLFSLQSTSKTVTALAFQLAAQKGLVKLDDQLVKYYPDFKVNSRYGKDQYKKITFKHLLTHSSGLAREARLGGVFNYDECSFEEHIKSINNSWLKFKVGDGFSYCNAGMDLVAYVLELITGKAYPVYVQEMLGNPLGITFNYDTKEISKMENSAKGYLGDYKAIPVEPSGYGCGIAHLSIKDQAKLVQFLLNLGSVNGKEILMKDYINQMRTPFGNYNYGLGTEVMDKFGTKFYYHNGGGYGFISEMYWSPEHDFGIAVFTNQEYNLRFIKELPQRILESVFKSKEISPDSTSYPYANSPQKDIKVILLDRLVGVYSGKEGILKINANAQGLYIDRGKAKERLVSHNELAFSRENTDGLIFELERNENPKGFKYFSKTYGLAYFNYLGRITKEQGPNRLEWKKHTGLYLWNWYHTEFAINIVKIVDGHLYYENDRLYEQSIPNLFFSFLGTPVIFEDEFLYKDNTKVVKLSDPVGYFETLLNEDPEHRALQGWVFDQAIEKLKTLKGEEEAEKISKLKDKFHSSSN